ncbi:MAG TPA: Spy/CpxP family protein refolding chaperone [Anaeromyxobacteraceae bacterium]|nr:Spy/CpxP family protein refolding chaperone [Anaeromyxobacteraceae bacterium]
MTVGRKVLIAVPVFAVALALAGWGACRHHAADPAQVTARVNARVASALDELNATPDQRARISALKDKLLADGLALSAARKDVRSALLALWDQPNPSAADVHALLDARIEDLRKFAHEAADAGLELHATLTPEQRAQVSAKIHRHADGR